MNTNGRVALVAIVAVGLSTTACQAVRENQHPVCDVRPPTVLMAESVRTAAYVPCVRSLPIGWAFESFDARDGLSTFGLGSEAGGQNALQVALRRRCPSESDASAGRPAGPPGVTVEREVASADPYRARWTYVFDGGCAVFDIAFAQGAPVERLLRDVRSGMSFLSRSTIDGTLERRQGQGLGAVEPSPSVSVSASASAAP